MTTDPLVRSKDVSEALKRLRERYLCRGDIHKAKVIESALRALKRELGI